jgi:hypothetical protein
MSDDSKDFLTVDEIKERIRSRVRQAGDRRAGLHAGSPVSAPRESLQLQPQSLDELRRCLRSANSLLKEVDAITERSPGRMNDFVQLVKKVTQRLLNWHLRPLRQFNASLLASLSETAHALEDFQTVLNLGLQRIDALEASLKTGREAAFPHRTGVPEHIISDAERQVHSEIELLRTRLEAMAEDLRTLVEKSRASGRVDETRKIPS